MTSIPEVRSRTALQLGVIADDVTGGTDLASTLRQAGLSVIQTMGQPTGELPDADAVVVSLKIRTAPPAQAVTEASLAARLLRELGAPQLYFKYCSTFDSTDRGNIGPIADRLLDDVAAPYTIATPAYPSLGRTVYLGHLFVGDRLLSDSSMRTHPLTPMTDSNLVSLLSAQSRHGVGLVDLAVVDAGPAAVVDRCRALAAQGKPLIVADAIVDRHLDTIGQACRDLPLVTGAAGLGKSLASQIRSRVPDPATGLQQAASGGAAILSGSCSAATRTQVERARAVLPSRQLDPMQIVGDPSSLSDLVDWSVRVMRHEPAMVFATAAPERVRATQQALGARAAADAVESAFKTIARAVADAGVRRFVVAGGETAGAVMDALGIRVVGFGREIAPGVPWTRSFDPDGYQLALKSGNFGGPLFFLEAVGDAG